MLFVIMCIVLGAISGVLGGLAGRKWNNALSGYIVGVVFYLCIISIFIFFRLLKWGDLWSIYMK